MTGQAAARAYGRSLKDFWLDDKGRLHPGEQALMAACAMGEWCVLDGRVPEEPGPDNFVRAGFVRFLALGGDAQAPVHEAGVWLRGAWIDGALDLSAAEVPHRLGLAHCRIAQLTAQDARLRGLHLRGSCLEAGLKGDRIKVTGGVNLRGGFRAGGEVRLLGAEIGGDLDCSGGAFENAGGVALVCDGIRVTGGVLLGDGFRAGGEVRLLGAEIGGELACSGGAFENAGGMALGCDGVRVTGGVFLRDGFRAGGEVRLLGAEIGGSLDCSGGAFENAGGMALGCDGATVKGRFFFREVSKLQGAVHLSSFHVGTLLDDAASWEGAKGELILDGFSYGRIDGDPAFTGADGRIAWLKSQRADLLGAEFRPQPWEQLVKVLREMGHPNEARKVAIAKQQALRDAGRIRREMQPLHCLYGQLIGFGYLPLRLLAISAAVWAMFAVIFLCASQPPTAFREAKAAVDATATGPFNAGLYSLDVLLPISLGYADRFAFEPGWLDLAVAAETLFGWIAGVLLLTAVGGLVRKD